MFCDPRKKQWFRALEANTARPGPIGLEPHKLGRAMRGGSGTLYPQSAIAGLNSHPRSLFSRESIGCRER
jgi:hypothetical protein